MNENYMQSQLLPPTSVISGKSKANQYYNMPGTKLHNENTMVNKTDTTAAFME